MFQLTLSPGPLLTPISTLRLSNKSSFWICRDQSRACSLDPLGCCSMKVQEPRVSGGTVGIEASLKNPRFRFDFEPFFLQLSDLADQRLKSLRPSLPVLSCRKVQSASCNHLSGRTQAVSTPFGAVAPSELSLKNAV